MFEQNVHCRAGWETPTECYYSCPLCDELTSCDWTTCYDDIGFIDFVINHAANYWCIDMNQIHLSGISNGGKKAIFKDWALKRFFYHHAFFIAILRFLPYKPEPELTNLRGKITKGSSFKSD